MKAFPSFASEYRNALKELYIDYQVTPNFEHCRSGGIRLDWHNDKLDNIVGNASNIQAERAIRAENYRAIFYGKMRMVQARTRLNMIDARVERRFKRPKQKLLAEAVAIYLKQPRLDILNFIMDMRPAIRLMTKLPELSLLAHQADKFDEEWRSVPWDTEPWHQSSPWYNTHNVHFSVKQQGMLAYNESVDKLKRDIQTQISPGRYLNRFFGHVLDQTKIKYWAEKFAAKADTSFELEFLNNDIFEGSQGQLMDEWVRLYRDVLVDYSCMRGDDSVRVYGKKGNHLGLAYLKNKEGTLFCRTIVRFDKMEYVRCYPYTNIETPVNENMMARLVEEAGFKSGSLEGIKVLYIDADEDGYVVMPYLDHGMGIEEGDGCVRLSRGGMDASSTDGTARLYEGTQCDRCGSYENDDNMVYIESEERYVCSSCCDEHYTWAMGRYDNEYWPNDEVVEVNGEFYAERYLSRHDIVQCCDCDTYMHIDDSYSTPDGEACHACCTRLDEDYDGCSFALNNDAVELSDGRVVHAEVADELQAEIDAEAEEGKSPLLVDRTPPEANQDMFLIAG